MSPSITPPLVRQPARLQSSPVPTCSAPSGRPSWPATMEAPDLLGSRGARRPLVPFVPVGGSVVKAMAAVREQLLAQWTLPVAPPSQPGHRWQARAMLAYLRDTLLGDPRWSQIEVFVGGSYPNYRMQVPWQRRAPRDLDPLFRIVRTPDACLEMLEQQVRAALAHVLASDGQTRGMHAPYLSSRIELSADGQDAMLRVTVGVGHEHADMRFIFADQQFSPYDFRCNALLVDAFDGERWTVLQGPRPQDVMDDIAQGVYCLDHALQHTGVLRASKMRAMGLVPAAPLQDAPLWHSLYKHLKAGGPQDPLGAGLRLNAVFCTEISRAYTGSVAAQDAGAILANALIGLQAQPHESETQAVYAQLYVSLCRVLARLAPSPALTALQAVFAEPAQLPRVALAMQALAAPPRLVSEDTAPLRSWPIEDPTSSGSGYIRFFCAALDAFICWATPTPPTLPPYAPLSPATVSPAPLHSTAHVAWLLDISAYVPLIPEAALADTDRRRQWSLRLGQLACEYAGHAPSTAQRLGLAALALCPRTPLAEPVLTDILALGAAPLSRGILAAWHQHAAEQAVSTLDARVGQSCALAAVSHVWRTLHDASTFFAVARAELLPSHIEAWQTVCQRAVTASARLAPTGAGAHATLALLVRHCPESPAHNAPGWWASCLHLRSQLNERGDPTGLRRALRAPLQQLQRAMRHSEHAVLYAREALQLPHDAHVLTRMQRLATCLALIPELASYLDEATALTLARTTQVGGVWDARQAVRYSLARLTCTPRLLRRLCSDTKRLETLLSIPALRTAVLAALDAAQSDEPAVLRLVLTRYMADGLMPTQTAQYLCRRWPTGAVMQEVQRRIAKVHQPQTLLVLWQRIRALSAVNQDDDTLALAPLFASVLRRLSTIDTIADAQRAACLSIGHLRAWRVWAPTLASSSSQACLGWARLCLMAGSPRDAMCGLQSLCTQALGEGMRHPGFLPLVQQAAEAMSNAPDARHADALKSMARAFLLAAHLDRTHLQDIGQTIRALSFALSQQGAHRLAGDLVQHAFEAWHQRGIVWAFGAGALWGAPSDLAWAQTLHRNLQDPDRQLVFVQLADRTARTTLASWADAVAQPSYPRPDGACLQAGLSATWRLIEARARPLPLRQHDMISTTLVKALQMPDIACALERHLDALIAPVDSDDVPHMVGLWQAWLQAAPDAASHALRRGRILSWLGFTQGPPLRAQWPADADSRSKRGAAMAALLPAWCSAHATPEARLSMWNDVVAALLQGRPQMAWLDAALSCAVETPARLQKRLEMHLLMRLRALQKQAVHAEDTAAFGISILHYALAMGGDPDNDTCARAALIEQVLQIAQTQLVHPYFNWLASVATFWDTSALPVRCAMPSVERLRAYFATAEAQKRTVPHGDAMQIWSEESLSYFFNAEGLSHLTHSLMFLGEGSQDRLKQWGCDEPWRLALMFGFRHSAWYETVLTQWASCSVMQACPNKGYLLGAIIDGLWDTGHLRYGPLIPLIQIAARLWRNAQLRPGLEAAMAKLTLFCRHHDVSDALGVGVALRQAEAQNRLNARGVQMMQRLLEALSLSEPAVLTVTAQSKVLRLDTQPGAN